uniref:F-box protein n=1 Tax=Noccaea caerulescens TaxID=107243 RepID=A0A1J3HPG3_NOCCA
MKHRDDEKVKFCSSRSKLVPTLLALKRLSFPAKFGLKPHTKKLDDEKDRRPITADPIPLDLEEAILTRLPAKSLMKLRCVSKMWSSMIRSQKFVDSYYAMSSATRSRFTIAFSNGVFVEDDAKRCLFIFSCSHEGDKSSSSLVANLNMTIPGVSMSLVSMCPSVHGFVTHSYSDRFTICNPSTGQALTVPCKSSRTSLGYDPVEDQFKALTLVSSIHHHHDEGSLVHEVITGIGGGGGGSRREVKSPLYYPVKNGPCINGFMYYGAWAPRQRRNPVIVCFDVRYERLSFIKAPKDVVVLECNSILIEYNGKLASIVRCPLSFSSFDLWILEDVEKQEWSKQTFELPYSLMHMTSPGTNKAGEIIFAPKALSHDVQPFCIFYYNLESKSITSVRIHGIGDDQGFRDRYGITVADTCFVSISSQHVESIASF